MQNVLHQTPLSAWEYLCNAGGIELDGRDEGLDRKIHLSLNPSALTLEDALLSATMDEFLSAFFAGIHPYIMIFRDILDFFENADATKGQSQWVLQVDNIDISLEHFRESIEAWTKIENVKLDVPALVPNGAWGLMSVLRNSKINTQIQKALYNKALDLPSDVQDWVDAYHKEQYLPIPGSFSLPSFPSELHNCVLIAQALVSILIKTRMTRKELIGLLSERGYAEWDSTNKTDFWHVVQNETDHCLCQLIVALSAWATLFEPDELKELDQDLNSFINEYPQIPIEMDIQLSDFDSILSLPIWKKRYELYSVWIATEIIRALDGHYIELHHDNGRIAFAFHETLIATIHSAIDPFVLLSERRSPLANPQGKSRLSNVQPDYGLWIQKKGDEICKIIVEVKHYKKYSKRNFVDALIDYANALRTANIYLVNYGPTGKTIEGVKAKDSSVSNRCFPMQFLTPLDIDARKRFAEAIRNCVGEPQKIILAQNQSDVKTVVFDVSGSMRPLLNSPTIANLKSHIFGIKELQHLIAVDYRLVGSFPASEKGFTDLVSSGGGYTELKKAVETLLIDNSSVIIVTDEEGLNTLNGLKLFTHEYQRYASKELKVCICIK